MAIVRVDCNEMDKNPMCPHGPTIKLTRLVKSCEKSFYACSAYRDRKDCQFFLWESDKLSSSKKLHFDNLREETKKSLDHNKLYNSFKEITRLSPKERRYCPSCNSFFRRTESSKHINHSGFKDIPLSDHCLRNPSALLTPKNKNKKEAQYWFSDSSTRFIVSLLKSCHSQRVICMGAPRIHETVLLTGMESLLLDIDPRFHSFYSPDNFCWFNMFNYWFLGDRSCSERTVDGFISSSPLSVVIDPPFGARLEPLARTLNLIKSDFSNKHNGSDGLFIFLALPYFMKPKVDQMDLGLNPIDFCLEYENHRFKRTANGSQKSPVRLFSNLTPSLIAGAIDSRVCAECAKVTPKGGEHCYKCGTCPDTAFFYHCDLCAKCFKNSWKHCKKCNRCCSSGHLCQLITAKKKKNKK